MSYLAASIFDPIADAYDSWYATPEGHAIFEEEVQCLRHLGDDYSGRWLEVGVGTGCFATAPKLISRGQSAKKKMLVISPSSETGAPWLPLELSIL